MYKSEKFLNNNLIVCHIIFLFTRNGFIQFQFKFQIQLTCKMRLQMIPRPEPGIH